MPCNYGYGVALLCDSQKITAATVDRIFDLLRRAPKYEKASLRWLDRRTSGSFDKSDYTPDELLELLSEGDESVCFSLAVPLREVISEEEGIELTAISTDSGAEYLVLEPTLPWNCPDWAKDLTPERLEYILRKYLSIVTDDTYKIGEWDISC